MPRDGLSAGLYSEGTYRVIDGEALHWLFWEKNGGEKRAEKRTRGEGTWKRSGPDDVDGTGETRGQMTRLVVCLRFSWWPTRGELRCGCRRVTTGGSVGHARCTCL